MFLYNVLASVYFPTNYGDVFWLHSVLIRLYVNIEIYKNIKLNGWDCACLYTMLGINILYFGYYKSPGQSIYKIIWNISNYWQL